MHGDQLRLVAITDNLRDGIDGLTRRAVASRRGGATMIQLRLSDEGPRTLSAAARALIAAVKFRSSSMGERMWHSRPAPPACTSA